MKNFYKSVRIFYSKKGRCFFKMRLP